MQDAVAELRTRIAGTTIDTGSFLSTDFFNGINEFVMFLGMLPEMPEMLAEIEAWQFRSYEEHFRGSGLGFAPLAIEAFAAAPAETRLMFDAIIEEMRETVALAKRELDALAAAGGGPPLGHAALGYARLLGEMVEAGSAVIHGPGEVSAQDAIDALF